MINETSAPMATIPAVQPLRHPITQSVPNSPQAQRAVFWSGIFLTTLLLAQVAGRLLDPKHNGETPLLIVQLVSVAFGYWAYFYIRSFWNTKSDDLESTPLLEIPLSNADPNLSNKAMLKVACWLLLIPTLVATFVGLLRQSQNLPLPMLAMLPFLSIYFWWLQPTRLRILPTGLVWQLPTATIYFPWHLIESADFAPGVTLDFLRWTAPTRWVKSFLFETKLSKLSDPDRERLQQLLAQHVPVKPE